MAANGTVVIKLSDLVDGQEAVCFAALVKKTRGMTKANQPLSQVPLPRQAGDASRRPSGMTTRSSGKPTRGPKASRLSPSRSRPVRPPVRHAARHPGHSTRDRRRRRATATTSSTWSPTARFRRTSCSRSSSPDRSLHRPSRPQEPGARTSSNEHDVALLADAGRPELPPFVHVRAARARLEHDADRRLPGRPLRQVLRRAQSSAQSRADRRGDDLARYRQAARARVSPGRGQIHQGRLPDRPRLDGPGHGSRGGAVRSTASPPSCS